MTWGTRSLVRSAAVVLFLHMALRSARASEVAADSTESDDAVDRLRRDSDQILIEHVKGVDDSQVTLSLFIGLLILAAVGVVVLIFLGCLLLVRLSESSCRSGPKYHRLLSSQETSSHRHLSRSCGGRSQLFTYVDLTNADGSCHEHRQLAPRFLAKFYTATNVDGSDTDLPREHRKKDLVPETRRSQVVRTSHPFSDEHAVKPSLRRTRSEDVGGSSTFSDREVAAADRMSEPPGKRICVQHISGAPEYRSGSVHDERGSDNYGERSVNVTSDNPQMDISVRDRFVKKRPHGDRASSCDSPLRRDDAHTVHQSAHGEMNHINSAQHPEQPKGSWNPTDFAMGQTSGETSGINSITPFSPWLESPSGSWSSPPLFPNNFPSFTASDRSSEHALRSHQNSRVFSGHGRSYEQHVPDGRHHMVVGPCATSRVESVGDSACAQRDRTSTAYAQPEFTQPVHETENGSDSGILAPNTDPVSAGTSDTMRNRIEHETAKVKHSVTSTGKSEEGKTPPITVKTSVSFQEMPSQQATDADIPHSSESREVMVRGPEMTTELDHPETSEAFKATFDGTAPNRAVLSEAQSRASPKGALPPRSPISSTKVSKQLRLPQPPRERHDKEVQTDLRGTRSASKRRYTRRHRRGGHTSGELAVMDEPADEKASERYHLPEYDLNVAKMPAVTTLEPPRPGTWLVPYDSPPLRNSTPATSDRSLVPSYNHGELTATDALSIDTDRQAENRGQEGSSTQHEENIHTVPVDKSIRPTDPVPVKEDVSVSGPSSVVAAEDRPLQTYERSIAVMTDSSADEVDKHVQSEHSKADRIESASESTLQVKHAAKKESETVGNESEKDERILVTGESPDVHNTYRERPTPATGLERGRTIESRVRPKWLPVESTSRELVSSDQSSQQLATLSDRALTQPVSQYPPATADDAHIVPSQAHEQALVTLSANSAQSDGAVAVVDPLKTSAIEAPEHSADDTRALATAGGRNVDVASSTDITKPAHTVAVVEKPEQRISVTTAEGPLMPSRVDGPSSSEVKERTESTDVFFAPTSPVAAQGSKDLISFTNEPLDGPSVVNSAENRTNTKAAAPNASPAKDDADKR